MAVNPKFAAHVFAVNGGSRPVHTLELSHIPVLASVATGHGSQAVRELCRTGVDVGTPNLWRRLFLMINEDVIPHLQATKPDQVEIIFRQLIQPWHPSSTLVHESALAVEKVAPGKFWEYSNALFNAQKEYFDVNVVNETRNQTYQRLAELAGTVEVDKDSVYKLLHIADKPDGDAYNIGNQVTNDVKFITKAARQVSAHVTPTVFFNGVVENSISSGWTLDQWKEWIDNNVV
ncbi:hypothetical protein TWF594_004649 [Orbilia oligospora]|uniref:Uncharacterized protein n=1 Tax=Orbilia oligospora TaxID=2813651 RepID=A0A7C8JR23_ORBOL|nr:hypothetical protein TWF706_002238 [Orbilia oligospora]KAF3125830.1 hypothetical protein TWF703_010649 [Orbilia oligospora]KAF3144485.1 hypothetical protein TWF594_004649 [Orbilia oligospora]